MSGSSGGNRRPGAGPTGRSAAPARSGGKRSARRLKTSPAIDLAAELHYRPAQQRLPQGRPFFFEFELKGMSDEAHLPAEQSGPQAAPRLPQPDGDRRRPQGAECPPRPRPQEAQRLVTLSKRADFLAANAGLRTTTPGFILPKKIGGAVVRNRMKRRLRALAREIVPAKGMSGADHVMIGRAKGIERDFAQMRTELVGALDRLRRQ